MAASIVGYRLWDQDTTVMPAALADCSAALAAAHASVSRSGAARLASILASTRLSETSASLPDWAAPAGSTSHRAMDIRPRPRQHNIASTTQSYFSAININYWNRSFGRDATDFSPYVGVNHHISDNECI